MIEEKLILSLAWVVISILLAVIAYFLKRLLVRFDIMNETLQDVVTKTAVQNATCKFSHEGVNARLKSHSEDIKTIKEHLKII